MRAVAVGLGLWFLSSPLQALPLKLCLTGTLVKVFPKYGAAFQNGASMAIEGSNEMVTEQHYYDQNALAPVAAIKEMVKAGCHIALGFDFTNDLIAVRDFARDNQLFVLSMYGGLNESFKDYKNIRTLQRPAPELVDHLFKFSTEKLKHKWSHPLIVTNVDRESMIDYRDRFETLLKPMGSNIQWVNSLERNFDLKEIKEAISKQQSKTDVVVLLARSKNAAMVADYLYEEFKAKTPLILGTEFFGSASLPAFREMLKHKEVEAYAIKQNALDDPDPNYQKFIADYSSKFKSDPMVISIMVHDAVNIVRLAASKLQFKPTDDITQQRIKLSEALNRVEFKGLTGVQVKAGLEFSYHKSFVVKVDQNGYRIAPN
jgi:hypothetical protein